MPSTDLNTKYLEATVMPVLEEGLKQLLVVRPADPIEWLATFLTRSQGKETRKITTGTAVDEVLQAATQ